MARYASVDAVYQSLKTILNKQQLGFVTPSQFNVLARQAQDAIFDKKIDVLNDVVRKRVRALESQNEDMRKRAEDDISTLLVYNEVQTATFGANIFDYPTNGAYIKQITYKGNTVDRVEPQKAQYYINAYYSAPQLTYPIAIMATNQIEVIPDNLAEGIRVTYYKRPQGSQSGSSSVNFPTWGYTSIGENEVYNAATSYDFELPSHLEDELVYEILSLMGFNLRDNEAVNYAMSKQAQDEQIEKL